MLRFLLTSPKLVTALDAFVAEFALGAQSVDFDIPFPEGPEVMVPAPDSSTPDPDSSNPDPSNSSPSQSPSQSPRPNPNPELGGGVGTEQAHQEGEGVVQEEGSGSRPSFVGVEDPWVACTLWPPEPAFRMPEPWPLAALWARTLIVHPVLPRMVVGDLPFHLDMEALAEAHAWAREWVVTHRGCTTPLGAFLSGPRASALLSLVFTGNPAFRVY